MRKLWADEERKKLAEIYPNNTTKYCADALSRTTSAISNQARKMGLKKSEHHLKHGGGRIKKGERVSKKTEFKKGQTPWNKGIKGLDIGGKETRFKKGHKPHNHKPIGSERITRDGYLQRKVTDTGYPPKDWVEVHRLIWEKHHGPIPKGHIVRFKDGNPLNVSIDNLEMISKAENARRNTIHRYPDDVKGAIYALASLKRGIKKYEQQKNDN